jgi:hypothetical protein
MRSSIWHPFFMVLTASTLLGCGGDDSHPASAWIGKTFLLDRPPTSRWVEPKKSSGGAMGDYVPQFLIGVAAGSGDNLNITLTTALDGVQDKCSPTTEVTVSGTSYPDVQITAASVPMHLTETDPDRAKVVRTTAHDVTLKDILPGRTETAATGELIATLDMAEAYPLFFLLADPTPDSVCAAFADADVICQTCTFNSQPYCLTFRAVQLAASESSTPVQKISSSDIGSDCP